MTREEFILFLIENQIPYSEYGVEGYDGVYVMGKKEYEMKKKHPRKNKNLYVPYVRVSHFDGTWYIREDGWCEYAPQNIVMKKIRRLGGLA